jgi:pimeloyl-ACP methyl ester carboxylesterase
MVTDAWVESVRRTVTTRFSALRVLRLARPLLPMIEAPSLLVWGRDDRVTPPSVAERFHQLIPRSWMVFLPRCGHAAMLEQPAAFASAVRHWLAETLRDYLAFQPWCTRAVGGENDVTWPGLRATG